MSVRRVSRAAINSFIASIVGACLYAVSIYLTSIVDIPGADNVQVRPGVVIPIVCGALFGPVAGFVSGFAGNLIADQALGWGFWPFWYLGNGLMGLAVGLFRPAGYNYARLRHVGAVLACAIVGIAVGMALASISELWVTQSSWDDVVWVNFVPAFLSNTLNAAILTPIVLLLYGILRDSTKLDPA
jgi:energy-coupling factor transport system substrate-specific component